MGNIMGKSIFNTFINISDHILHHHEKVNNSIHEHIKEVAQKRHFKRF